MRDFQTYLRLLEEGKGYAHLQDAQGQAFATLADFTAAKAPFGLGYDPEVILHIQQETREMLLKDKLRELGHGGDRRSAEFQVDNYKLEKAK